MRDHPKSTSNQTYNDAMSEWARLKDAERALFNTDRNTLLHPDPMAPLGRRILGYAWRLGLLALILCLIAASCLFLHLRHPSFSQKVAQGLKETGDLQKVTLSPLQWTGESAKSRGLSAEGHAQSLIRSLEAEIISMKFPLQQLWEKEWTIEELHAARVNVQLRGGAVTNFSAEPDAAEASPTETKDTIDTTINVQSKLNLQDQTTPDNSSPGLRSEENSAPRLPFDEADKKPLKTNAFGISPDPTRFQLRKLSTEDLTLNWGAGTYTRGSLIGSRFDLVRTKANHWNLSALGGTLSLAWLQNINLNGLNALYTGSKLEFSESKFSVEAGQGLLTGHVTMEQAPQVHLKCQLTAVPLDSFIDPTYRDHLSLVVNGPTQLRGSTNLSTGITTENTWTIASGRLRELPVLQTLATLTSRLRLRQLEITGGKIQVKTAQGRLEVPAFVIESGDDVRITGHFSLEKKRFLGEAKIGFKSVFLNRVSTALVSEFFPADAEGWHWLTVPIDGPLETLTASTAAVLARADGQNPRPGSPVKK
jgi:hypothetical protein